VTQQKKNGRNKSSGNGQTPDGKGSGHARADKKAQFEDGGKRSPLVWIMPVVALSLVALAVVVAMSRGGSDEPAAAAAATTATQPTASGGGPVSIPMADVSDGTVHFFETDVNGTTVKYFAVKATDGTMRTSLDACQVCFQAKKGYSQDGANVICGNCGRSFAIDQIGVQHGGCNPISIESTTKGDQLVIDPAGIDSGVQYFQ